MARKKRKRRAEKRRQRRLNLVPIPGNPMVTENDSIEILSEAYSISIYWDNDLNVFIAELDDFNTQIHSPTWLGAAAAAKVAHSLLVENYRLFSYSLPEVG